MEKTDNKFGLYIHIPFCTSKCDYCDFFSVPCGTAIKNEYLEALARESLYYCKKFNIQMWSTIYIGGGTPSILLPGQIKTLFAGLRKPFEIWHTPTEITMEMNPQSISSEKLESAYSNGVDRLSLGIQSMTGKSLESVHRMCSSDTAEKAVELVKKQWKGRLNLDCIAGLPEQSDEEFVKSLEKIISFYPDHISLYTLTIEDGTPLAKRIEGGMPYDFDKADFQWLTGRDILKKHGYLQYEVSNFSLQNCRSRHNMMYWRQEDYIGIGAGATGTVYGWDNGKGIRWTNTRDINLYIDFWLQDKIDEREIPREIEILSEETQEFEYLMMGLRTFDGLSPEEYMARYSNLKWKGNLEQRLGVVDGYWKHFKDRKMVGDFSKTGRYSLNESGILFLNQVLEKYL